jgi:hypothetical protein
VQRDAGPVEGSGRSSLQSRLTALRPDPLRPPTGGGLVSQGAVGRNSCHSRRSMALPSSVCQSATPARMSPFTACLSEGFVASDGIPLDPANCLIHMVNQLAIYSYIEPKPSESPHTRISPEVQPSRIHVSIRNYRRKYCLYSGPLEEALPPIQP